MDKRITLEMIQTWLKDEDWRRPRRRDERVPGQRHSA